MFWLLALLTIPAQADDDNDDMRFLISGKGKGGFGAPEFGVASLGGRAAYRVGGRGGWVINDAFIVGGYGESITSGNDAGELVRIVDGGIFAEVHLFPNNAIHASLDGGIAAGSVSWAGNNGAGFIPYAAARLELNVVTWLRASIGPSLRGVVSNAVPEDASRSSFGGDLLLKFGAF